MYVDENSRLLYAYACMFNLYMYNSTACPLNTDFFKIFKDMLASGPVSVCTGNLWQSLDVRLYACTPDRRQMAGRSKTH